MTPNDIAAASERYRRLLAGGDPCEIWDYPERDIHLDRCTLSLAYLQQERAKALAFEATNMADIERAIRGHDAFGHVWPDWVYEARAAVRHMGDNPPPWLPDLHAILGWQGGTVHQALNAVRRLVETEKERVRK